MSLRHTLIAALEEKQLPLDVPHSKLDKRGMLVADAIVDEVVTNTVVDMSADVSVERSNIKDIETIIITETIEKLDKPKENIITRPTQSFQKGKRKSKRN